VVNALGDGRVLVSNINGEIEAGDYITTSAIAGYGQRQENDLVHSYTVGKATETVDWDKVTKTVEYQGRRVKIYLIAVVYTSG
jgi:NAD dependent epimerase/dehydratase family enzyme